EGPPEPATNGQLVTGSYLFDEWAADHDSFFRELFYLELLPDLKNHGETVLVIGHDERYYHCANRIIKLDSGAIVEDSDADLLLAEPTSSLYLERRIMEPPVVTGKESQPEVASTNVFPTSRRARLSCIAMSCLFLLLAGAGLAPIIPVSTSPSQGSPYSL